MRRKTVLRTLSASLVSLCAACASAPPPENYALGRSSTPRTLQPLKRQLLVAEPGAIQPLDGDQFLVSSGGRYAMIGGGRWSDRIPRLLQLRILQAFESQGRAVGRVGSGLNGDLILAVDLRAFEIAQTGAAGEGPSGEIDVTARIVEAQTGRILAARSFRASSPATGVSASEAAAALDAAVERLMPQLTRWSIGIAGQ